MGTPPRGQGKGGEWAHCRGGRGREGGEGAHHQGPHALGFAILSISATSLIVELFSQHSRKWRSGPHPCHRAHHVLRTGTEQDWEGGREGGHAGGKNGRREPCGGGKRRRECHVLFDALLRHASDPCLPRPLTFPAPPPHLLPSLPCAHLLPHPHPAPHHALQSDLWVHASQHLAADSCARM